jgi:hypothetical protein|tara:strand:+ start:311 stop:454 length:144 start_codon:yes stop_codon:yes gene_type:complete
LEKEQAAVAETITMTALEDQAAKKDKTASVVNTVVAAQDLIILVILV